MSNPCIASGCPRQAMNSTKPGLCARCYQRRHYGYPPKFPAQPLVDYMAKRGKSWRGTIPENWVTLERMDAVCIDILGVHPSVIYGDLYYQECVS